MKIVSSYNDAMASISCWISSTLLVRKRRFCCRLSFGGGLVLLLRGGNGR